MKSKNFSDNQDFANYVFEKKKDILKADAFDIMRKYFKERLNEVDFLKGIELLSNHNVLTFKELIDYLKPIAAYESLEMSYGKSEDKRTELKRKFMYIRSIEV